MPSIFSDPEHPDTSYVGNDDVAIETVRSDRQAGAVLEAYVASHEVDLLVMGAYGHSRLREFVLGGATKSLLSKPPLPILFSH